MPLNLMGPSFDKHYTGRCVDSQVISESTSIKKNTEGPGIDTRMSNPQQATLLTELTWLVSNIQGFCE
jgi:hypothetical protein